jgi:hypothetical protein
MKKLLFVFSIAFFISVSAFSDTPTFLVETNTSYAIGINLDNAVPDLFLTNRLKRLKFR